MLINLPSHNEVLEITEKEFAEVRFWAEELRIYQDWYEGKRDMLYFTPAPTDDAKIKGKDDEESAILTWMELHQKPKYLYDLQLETDAFRGLKVLDIGAGPFPSATCFEEIELFALDPLADIYEALGFPRKPFPNVHFTASQAEEMPFESDFIDAVISVNAIDHVDNFEETAAEICRVLKPGGKFAMHVHYHEATECEPLELNDERFLSAFSEVEDLQPICRSRQSFGTLLPETEEFVLWRNF